MKIEAGKVEFEFEPDGEGKRVVTVGVVGALRAALGGEGQPQGRFDLADRLRAHVLAKSGVELDEDEADGLLSALLDLDAKKKQTSGPRT